MSDAQAMPEHCSSNARALLSTSTSTPTVRVKKAFQGGEEQKELIQSEEVGGRGSSPGWLSESPPPNWLDVLPAQANCLRDYQRQQVDEVATAMHEGVRRVIVQLATGGGKTHEIAAIVAAAAQAGMGVLILATRTRLVRQLHERLLAFDVNHGVIAAPLPTLHDFQAPVQVASVDTLHRRAKVRARSPLPVANVVIFDEAHLATAETRLALLDSYPDAIRIGFTATPARKSGKGLGRAFDRIITGPSIRELTARGMLVATRIFASPLVTEKELRALPKDSDNDFATGALGALIGRPKLIGDVVSNWQRIANGRRTICFAVDKAHAGSLLDEFCRHGIAAEMLTDQDSEDTREQVIQRLETGVTKVLVNCFLLSYGTDLPSVECIVLARPTRSLVMYLQMVGRGLRASPGKSECVVIDHGHVVESLGMPHADRNWTLDERRNVNAETLTQHRKCAPSEKPRTCPTCSTLWLTSESGNACPSCGWLYVPPSRAVKVQQADLEEIAEAEVIAVTDARVESFYREAMGWDMKRSPDKWAGNDPNTGKSRANARRWAAWMRAVERFKLGEQRKPGRFWNLPPVACSDANAGWLLSRQIRFARAKQRAA